MSAITPKIQKNHKKPYNPEITFKDQNHLLSYLVDKISTNRNRRFNMKLRT